MKDIRHLGLDVDSEKIAVAVAEPGGEVRSLGTIPYREDSVRRLVKKLGPASRLRVCYEAGPHGYSLYWYEREKELRRFDWKHGCVFAPTDGLFHQHFNASPEPARYLAVAFGGLRYPTLADKRATFTGMDVNVKEGGRQIEYEDEDPRIRQIYEEELRKNGVPSRMGEFLPA